MLLFFYTFNVLVAESCYDLNEPYVGQTSLVENTFCLNWDQVNFSIDLASEIPDFSQDSENYCRYRNCGIVIITKHEKYLFGQIEVHFQNDNELKNE